MSTKIIASSGKHIDYSDNPLFECKMEHKVTETSASFNWKGPKITAEQWREVLAFFAWTYKEHKSEAQVRAFVHPTLGWKFWAFPQQGGTGMTTKELDTDDFKKQRADQIPAGFIAYGTVHHHCAMQAFQSGTDSNDESNVDGLHITVGKIDEKKHDIHCRLYHKSNKFEPNMGDFWSVGTEQVKMCEYASSLGFDTSIFMDRIARNQMCEPAAENAAFPALWKENYIVSHSSVQTYGYGRSTVSWLCDKCQCYHNPVSACTSFGKSPSYGKDDCEVAIDELTASPFLALHAKEEIFDAIVYLGSDDDRANLYTEIVRSCIKHQILVEDLCEHLLAEVEEKEVKKELKEEAAAKGVPDYEGQGSWEGYGG